MPPMRSPVMTPARKFCSGLRRPWDPALRNSWHLAWPVRAAAALSYNLRWSSTRLALPRLRSMPPAARNSMRAVVPM